MSSTDLLKIHEETTAEGNLAPIFLRVSGDTLELVNGSVALSLPEGALSAVLSRFGAPFDPEASIAVVGTLDLGAGESLRHVRHLAGYDVIARDYLVYERSGEPALCALATPVTAALLHLARAKAARA
ncbi:MAG TPA: hypothetical protein VG937_25940 [Polyangiaceae bacterium]|nr:hypothetical protein [Polyangiaceae bacterium]